VFQFKFMIITVSTYTTAIDAYIAKGRLEAEGIPVYIADEHYISAQWTISQALGGVRLQVPTLLESEALKIITEIEQGSYQVSLPKKPIESESTHCPNCNSGNTYQVNWVWKLSFVLMFMNIHLCHFHDIGLSVGNVQNRGSLPRIVVTLSLF